MNCIKSLRKWKVGLGVMLAMGLPLGAAAMQWPDTGQRSCYDNEKMISCPDDKTAPFYGQDAQYNGPAHLYTKLAAEGVELYDSAKDWIMVRDNVTGLIWEVKNSFDAKIDYSNPNDADNKYTWCNPALGYHAGTCGDDSSYDTEEFITALNDSSFGGFSDWRMPSVQELATLLYMGPAPLVDWNYFQVAVSLPYWSGTPFAGDSSKWYISFNSSNMGTTSSSSKYYALAVRGGL